MGSSFSTTIRGTPCTSGATLNLPRRSYVSTDVYYGSGFANGNPPPDHLPGHTTFDLTLGKDFGERFSASLSATNVANRRFCSTTAFTLAARIT